MATTANTQRSTPSVRGNHPAGRALLAPAGGRRDALASAGPSAASGPGSPLRLVHGGRAVPAVEPSAEVLAFRPRPVRPDAPADTGAAGAPTPVRLTRRGRRAVAGLVLVGGLGLAALVGPAVFGTSAGSGLALAGENSVVVQPGDTLWSIARQLAPDEDPRGVVDALQAANDLQGTALVPGQVLRVP